MRDCNRSDRFDVYVVILYDDIISFPVLIVIV